MDLCSAERIMPQVAFKILAARGFLNSPESPAFREQLGAAFLFSAFFTISAALGVKHPVRAAFVEEQIPVRMSYFRLGLLRIELKAPVARHTNRVYGIAFVAFRATISLLAIVKHPSPITAWARAACCYGRPMEPLEAVRLLELGVRLPNEVSF